MIWFQIVYVILQGLCDFCYSLWFQMAYHMDEVKHHVEKQQRDIHRQISPIIQVKLSANIHIFQSDQFRKRWQKFLYVFS